MKLLLAFSPCPNDTFMFHDLATGSLRLPGSEIEVHLHDVETLNRFAAEERFDVTKLSFHAWLTVREHYRLLSVGAALGHGCGPVVVSRRPVDKSDLPNCRAAIPGELTTAHLLFRLWAPEAADRIFVAYDRVFDTVASGEADCGVVIHEGRFLVERMGFTRVVDLGSWWEEATGLPIPLGCIAARKALPDDVVDGFERLIGQSIRNSLAAPERTLPYIRQHAQELDEDVLAKHVETFVNEYSLDLGDDGRAAVARLEEMALSAGVMG